jgi:hypothetical protein
MLSRSRSILSFLVLFLFHFDLSCFSLSSRFFAHCSRTVQNYSLIPAHEAVLVLFMLVRFLYDHRYLSYCDTLFPLLSCNRQPFDFVSPNFPSHSLSLLVYVQVEYYFSRENLCQDSFLVSKMDAQHFVDVAIIADFKMVKQLTSDTDLILACVAGSDKVCFIRERQT